MLFRIVLRHQKWRAFCGLPISTSARCFSSSGDQVSTITSASTMAALTRSGRYHASQKSRKISEAMLAYVKKMNEKEKLLKAEMEEFELGKRHLANIMSLDPETMTQEDIDASIQYLFPSGLFSPHARPTMKPPQFWYGEVEPPKFSITGRPFDDMFYTRFPTVFQFLYTINEKTERLLAHEEAQVAKGIEEPSEQLGNLGPEWVKSLIEQYIKVELNEFHFKTVCSALDSLMESSYSYLEQDFILKFRPPPPDKVEDKELGQETTVDENGRLCSKAFGDVKNSKAWVSVYPEGTGQIIIDGKDMFQFHNPQARHLLTAPFLILNRFKEFDVVATTVKECNNTEPGANEISTAGAVRLGISRAIRVFITSNEIEKLRVFGLLTKDYRKFERNKPNYHGARTKPVWKRR